MSPPWARVRVSHSGAQATLRSATFSFESYRLEFGSGASPRKWTTITQQSREVESGAVGVWSTNSLEPGLYTLRLVVKDKRDGDNSATVAVNVGPPTSPTPVGTPVAPP